MRAAEKLSFFFALNRQPPEGLNRQPRWWSQKKRPPWGEKNGAPWRKKYPRREKKYPASEKIGPGPKMGGGVPPKREKKITGYDVLPCHFISPLKNTKLFVLFKGKMNSLPKSGCTSSGAKGASPKRHPQFALLVAVPEVRHNMVDAEADAHPEKDGISSACAASATSETTHKITSFRGQNYGVVPTPCGRQERLDHIRICPNTLA